MAKSSPKPKRMRLPALTGIQKHIVAHMMTCIAFENYGECCVADALAENFGRNPARFLQTLRKLEEKGYIRIKGETYPQVYPTVQALRSQDPRLSQEDAERIVRRIGG